MSDCRSHEQAHILRNLEESIDALYDQQGEQQQPISRDVGHCLSLAMLNNGEVYAPIEVPFPGTAPCLSSSIPLWRGAPPILFQNVEVDVLQAGAPPPPAGEHPRRHSSNTLSRALRQAST